MGDMRNVYKILAGKPETLTPWSRVLLEKLTVTQLLNKLPALYINQKFITLFTRLVTDPYPEPDESNPHPSKSPLTGSRRIWEDNIRMDLRKISWEGVDRSNVAQDRDQWQAVVNTVMNLRVSYREENFLTR
jgi:hypothetical protein